MSAPTIGSALWLPTDMSRTVSDLVKLVQTWCTRDESIAFLSEHKSLERDSDAVEMLRKSSYRVFGAGRDEVRFEHDKMFAKRLFDGVGLRSPLWSQRALNGDDVLFKASAGTQGTSVHWAHERAPACSGYYEEYVSGEEYSTIVVVRESGYSILPSVWKGSTMRSLLPPFERLRVAGPGVPEPLLDAAPFDALGRLISKVCVPIILEVEYIVDALGQYFVIEVNPRIAGTTRMAALAGNCDFLDLLLPREKDTADVVAANRLSVELPLERRGCRPLKGPDVYATSRLTIAGKDIAEIMSKLRTAEDAGWLAKCGAKEQLTQLLDASTPDLAQWTLR